MFGGGHQGRYLAGIIWITLCLALIVGGIRTILRAREAASWDPAVTKMSVGSGILGILLGLGLLWYGFTQLRAFGIFPFL
jgi:hypothetical protein